MAQQRRTTFNESWYKVAHLKLRLRISLKLHRQFYRGTQWFVLQDPINNSFFRLNRAAYQFLAMLDGRRDVNTIWQACLEEYDEMAPTQGEVIQLLGQLYTSNLLQGDVPVDTEGLLKRHKQRKRKEYENQLKGILFAKIPLWDPDLFLNRFVGLFRWLFGYAGLLLFLGLFGSALFYLSQNTDELYLQAQDTLSPGNIPILVVIFTFIKVVHEFGHGFACKHFGQEENQAGEVRKMGIMLMLMTPIPFVDATSSWALRNKWKRIFIAAAGMYVELMLAAVAAIVWANTSEGDAVHIAAYNVMFISSITTLLFNGNPLLKYDAYYMLSDVLEIPNMAQKGVLHYFYLVKRYIWGVKAATPPTEDKKEQTQLIIYAVLSYFYRFVIFSGIFFILAETAFILGFLYGCFLLYTFILAPVNKLVKFLKTSPELRENRKRAIGSVTVVAVILAFIFFAYPVKSWTKVEGVVEPIELVKVFAHSDGFVNKVLENETAVAQGDLLISSINKEYDTKHEKLQHQLKELQVKRKIYLSEDTAKAQITAQRIIAVHSQIAAVKDEIRHLQVFASSKGHWIAPDLAKKVDSFVKKGDYLGMISSIKKLHIRAVVDQDTVDVLSKALPIAHARIKGRPDIQIEAKIKRVFSFGKTELPSAALGYAGGGEIEVDSSKQEGTESKEKIFEILLTPQADAYKFIKPGQVLIIKFNKPKQAIIVQVATYLQQLFQRRLQI